MIPNIPWYAATVIQLALGPVGHSWLCSALPAAA